MHELRPQIGKKKIQTGQAVLDIKSSKPLMLQVRFSAHHIATHYAFYHNATAQHSISCTSTAMAYLLQLLLPLHDVCLMSPVKVRAGAQAGQHTPLLCCEAAALE